MNPFTEEQETFLYMIGLDVDRMTEEEKKDIHTEITTGSCRLDGDEMLVTGCPSIEGKVKRFALRLLARQRISSSVIDAVRTDARATLRIRRDGDSYTMMIHYKPSKGTAGTVSTDGVEKAKADGAKADGANVRADGADRADAVKEQEWKADTYLERIVFSTDDAPIKKRLMETIGVSLSDMRRGMMNALEPLRQKRKDCTPTQKSEWISCSGGCRTIAEQAIQQEISSTAYILRSLAQSLLVLDGKGTGDGDGDGDEKIEFALSSGSPTDLTGRWKEDRKHIRLVGYGAPVKEANGRLVMGFGPSASGKTYLTTTLLTLLRKVDPSLPPVFLSIDGGIYREVSYTYDLVKQVATSVCSEGFDNLVLAGMSSVLGSLFNSGAVKKNAFSFLKEQTLPIHLYVPETLGSCLVGSCESIYQPYKEITKDPKWIGLLIWQHKEAKDCTFPPGYRCKGCTESGVARQKKEGKKYSNAAWEGSMKNGEAEFLKAPGGRYKIHNGGQLGSTTVMVDHSQEISDEKRKVFQDLKGIRYLTHGDAQEYIQRFEEEAKGLKVRVAALATAAAKAGAGAGADVEAKQSLQQEYERLLEKSNDDLHRIYRALYPVRLAKSDQVMEQLKEKRATFVTETGISEKKYDTLEVKVYYIRHGYSCANAERNQRTGLKTPWSHTMVADPSLHPKGIKQAQALGEDLGRYVANGGPIDGFFTSQLYRAIQTGLLLRQVSGSNQIPLHVVPHICEVGNPLSLDNNPSKIEEINKHTSVIEEAGPVHITTEWGHRDKSDVPKFVDGPLHDWLIQRRKESPNQKQFTVFIVAHSTLLHKAFGIKPDNCQLIPVTYSFTSSGFLLGTRRPTEEDIKAVKAQFPSPYSGTEYTVDPAKPTCQDACKDLEDVSNGLDVTRLLDIVNTCVQTKGKSD